MADDDVSAPSYWNDLYLAGDAGWDKGKPSPPIVRMAGEKGLLPAGASIAVLGAGRGHEAVALAKKGFRVTAIDFAAEAVKAIRANAKKAKVELEALQADVFTLPASHAGAFDAALEHTCFCAIDPERRAEYAAMARAILKPGGIFFGLFYAHGRDGGPPFTTTEAEVRRLFAPHFGIDRLVVPKDGFPERKGNELEFVFRATPARS